MKDITRKELYNWCKESPYNLLELSEKLKVTPGALSLVLRTNRKVSLNLADKIVELTGNKIGYTYLCPDIFSPERLEKINGNNSN